MSNTDTTNQPHIGSAVYVERESDYLIQIVYPERNEYGMTMKAGQKRKPREAFYFRDDRYQHYCNLQIEQSPWHAKSWKTLAGVQKALAAKREKILRRTPTGTELHIVKVTRTMHVDVETFATEAGA